jgi:hypothetical protein
MPLPHEGPLPQPLPGKLGPLPHAGPLFQGGMFIPLPHAGPLFQGGMFIPLPHAGPLPQPIFGPPPHEGPLPMLKPLPGPLPHEGLLPQFMFGLKSKLSKPQPVAWALREATESAMPAMMFFIGVCSHSFWSC